MTNETDLSLGTRPLDGFDLPTRAGGLLGQARAVEARSADLMRRCRVLHAGIVRCTAPRVADVRAREKFQGE